MGAGCDAPGDTGVGVGFDAPGGRGVGVGERAGRAAGGRDAQAARRPINIAARGRAEGGIERHSLVVRAILAATAMIGNPVQLTACVIRAARRASSASVSVVRA
ncbi:hypothetical protein GCM10022248_91350 [Nonomuraea soli]